MPQSPPRILILTASAGAGHNVAAEAMRQAFAVGHSDVEVEVRDVLQYTNGFFRRLYAQGYLGIVNYVPTAMGWLYEATDRVSSFRDGLRTAFQNINAGRCRAMIRAWRPDLIINTHFLSAELVAVMRRRGELHCPQATVTTDFETHRLWVQDPTERYYTATCDGKAYLTTWGVPCEAVRVTGIPVRSAFVGDHSQAQARRALGLDVDRPVVLMTCGGFGVGPTVTLFTGLLDLTPAAQIVVITGRNERLRHQLLEQRDGRLAGVHVIGFTEEMHTWMRAADVLVTKPGGLTVSEALVSSLPMVIVNPIPGQETRNSDYLLERGAAIKVNNPRLLAHRLGGLLAEPGRLGQLRSAAGGLARPGAARAIAADALELAGAAGTGGAN